MTSDGGPDTAIVDGATDATTPDGPLGPFGPPVRVVELESPVIDDDPTLTPDMLEMYFASGRPTGNNDNIYVTTRASSNDPWGAPVPVTVLNTGASESEPELSADGLTLRISRVTGNGNDIFESTRVGLAADWSSPVYVSQLSSTSGDYAATEDESKLRLVMSSERVGGGNEDLYVSIRTVTTLPWGTPMPITELNSPETDSNPFPFEGGLAICFDTTRISNQRILHIAQRPAADAPFGAPEPISNIDSPGWDADCWLSPDQRTIFFSSDRSGNREIWTASR